MFAFFLTTGGWFVWNLILDSAYSKSPAGPYNIKDSFTQLWGRDATWWATLFMTLSFLGLLELSGKVLKRHLLVAGMWSFPPWKRRKLGDGVGDWDLALWQEMEQDPAMMRRSKRLARDEDADDLDDDEDDEDDIDGMLDGEEEEEVVNVSRDKTSTLAGKLEDFRRMIPMKMRRGGGKGREAK